MKPRPVRFIDSFVRSFVRSFVPSFLHSFVPSFLRSFLPAFLDAPVFSSSRASNRIGDDYRVTMLLRLLEPKEGKV